jgi:hypothetical protein
MQMKLDFSRVINTSIDNEKKTEMVSFRAGERFKADLQAIAAAKNVDLAVLVHEYAIAGYLEDYKNIMLLQMNEKKTVRELLRQG